MIAYDGKKIWILKFNIFFDKSTATLSYVLWDKTSHDGVIIDPVWNYDPVDCSLKSNSIRELIDYCEGERLKIHLILETHAHADHISGSQELKLHFPDAKIGIGQEITKVQSTFKNIFNLPETFKSDGSQFDCLISEEESFSAGSLKFRAIHNPGHTEACYSFLIENLLFCGDALFMPDFGVSRCDFPQGSAETLFDSITRKLYQLPDSTKVFTGHDYQPGGRELQFQTTIEESKKSNIHLNSTTTREEFVSFRTQRDKQLSVPKLLLPSIQVNIMAGILPIPESNGQSYLKIPISLK